MLEASKEIHKSHVYKTNKLCVVACCIDYASYEDRSPLEAVIKEELPPKIIEEGQMHKNVISEEETTLSHKSSQRGDYTCSKNEGA